MRRKKRGFVRVVLACWIAVCVLFAIPKEVKAEKKESTELAELLGFDGWTCYDCGAATEDGAFQIKTSSDSMKQGDIVEVEIWFSAGKTSVPNVSGFYSSISWDGTVLQYMETNIINEQTLGCSPSITTAEPNQNEQEMELGITYGVKPLDKSACIATVKFEVLKDAYSTKLYFDSLSVIADKFDVVDYYHSDEKWIDIFTLSVVQTELERAKISLSGIPVRGSKDISIPINIKSNSGFNLLGLTIDYDASLFGYEGLDIDDALKSKISLDSVYEIPERGQIKASFIALEDITDAGNFLNLKLKAKDGAAEGATSNVTVSITQVGNKGETEMEGIGTSCKVTLTDSAGTETPVLGDVNLDKNIDLVDAVYILQHYNEVRVFTDAQKTTADVSKDGVVNLTDALIIMKYFNGEISTF